ncbi:MAG: ECF transporter S component [Oscillospiraceae bacterium]|nr:ECF transporter S component [Oscillospiraceae bacterium]
MKDKTLKKLVFAALFAALACVATMVIKIPTPTGGYIHAGDAVVLLSAFILGPWWGAAAAGLGSCLADLLSGYALYAPGTFAVKFLVALVAGLLLGGRFIKNQFAKSLVAGIVGEVVMVLGYLVYEAFVLGYGAAALGGVPMNLIQGAFGVVAGSALYIALLKTKYFSFRF